MHKDHIPHIQYIDLSKLHPNEENEKSHTEKQINLIAASIMKRGFLQPIVVDKNFIIVAGHARYEAAKKLGLEKIPCVIADHLSDTEIDAYRIADNKLNESAWNFSHLQLTMQKLQSLSFDLMDTAFELQDQEKIIEWAPKTKDENASNPQVIGKDIREAVTEETRQIVFIMKKSEYETLIVKLLDLQDEMQVDTNVEVLIRLIAAYGNSAR